MNETLLGLCVVAYAIIAIVVRFTVLKIVDIDNLRSIREKEIQKKILAKQKREVSIDGDLFDELVEFLRELEFEWASANDQRYGDVFEILKRLLEARHGGVLPLPSDVNVDITQGMSSEDFIRKGRDE